jgi:hypothetical protein
VMGIYMAHCIKGDTRVRPVRFLRLLIANSGILFVRGLRFARALSKWSSWQSIKSEKCFSSGSWAASTRLILKREPKISLAIP